TANELSRINKIARKNNIQITVIGKGSNLIVRDGGFRGIVISLKHFNNYEVSEDNLIIESGVSIIDASIFALNNNLTGFEFACGIPGSIGGGIYMNAGAYGGEFKDILESCKVIDYNGNIITKSNEQMNFGYRYSSIQ